MTYERGRQEVSPEKAAPSLEKNREGTCGVCGREIGGGPRLVYMPKIEGKLKEMRVCPFCFVKIITGVRA